MSIDNIRLCLPDFFLRRFTESENTRYSVWVYDGNDIISVYQEKMPNTVEIWFEFRSFTRAYWILFESECISERRGERFYDFNKVKKFMMTYMISGTNFPGVGKIQYGDDGKICDDVMKKLNRIHPRIWSQLFEKIDVFPGKLPDSEEMALEKQCKTLFCDSQSVQNPHEWVVMYCTLLSFWEKFGLNYFDVMKLPNDLYNMLKKMSGLENSYREMGMAKQTAKTSSPVMNHRFPRR